MAHFLERVRWAPYAAVAALGALLSWQTWLGTFDGIDAPATLWLAQWAPSQTVPVSKTDPGNGAAADPNPPAVTLIEIGDPTREQTWPLQPLDYAAIFRALQVAKPPLLVVEEVLWWPDGTPFLDSVENYLLRFPQVLLAWELGTPKDPGFAFEGRPVLRRVKGSSAQVPECEGAQLAPSENLALLAAQGYVALDAVLGAPVRRIPLLVRAGRDLLPAATLRAAMLWWRLSPEDVEVEIGRHVLLGRHRTLPIDERGAMPLAPAALQMLQRFETGELLLAAERRETSRHPQIPLGAIENRAVFVGRTDREARVYRDLLSTPVSRVELFAAALAAIQADVHVRRTPIWGYTILVGVAMGLLWWARRGRRRRAFMGAAMGLGMLAVAAGMAYAGLGIHAPLTMSIVLASAVVLYRVLLPGRIQRGHGGRSVLRRRAARRRTRQTQKQDRAASEDADTNPGATGGPVPGSDPGSHKSVRR